MASPTQAQQAGQPAPQASACVPRSRDGSFQVRCAAFPFSPPSCARRWRVTDLHARLLRTSLLARSREPNHAVLDEEQVLEPVLDEADSEIPHPKHELEQLDVPGPSRRSDARSADSMRVEDWRTIYRATLSRDARGQCASYARHIHCRSDRSRVHCYCQRTVSRTCDTHVLRRCARPHLNSSRAHSERQDSECRTPPRCSNLRSPPAPPYDSLSSLARRRWKGTQTGSTTELDETSRRNRAFVVAFVGPSSNPTLTCVAAWCIAAHPLR